MKYLFVVFIFLCSACTAPVDGDVIFFVNDVSGFETATSSLGNLGIEDFESSTLGPDEIGQLVDPLEPGVANGALPFGTNLDLGMTLQSNTLAGNASSTSPLGIDGLATYSDGFGSSPTDQLIANFSFHSLDMIFEPNTRAVNFLPIFVDRSGNPGSRGAVEVEVYDSDNVLVGSQIIDDVSFFFTDVEVGIVATDSTQIGRINLYDGDAFDWQGVDDITVYSSVPEPASAMLIPLIGLGITISRNRKPVEEDGV